MPTKHTGSWIPGTNVVLCGRKECRALPQQWERDLLANTGTTWAQRSAQECQVCQEHRHRRCRVLRDANDHIAENIKFSDAPLIIPFNEPKYHASLVQARRFARDTNRILLWVVAEDTPLHVDLRSLSSDELDQKRKEWLMLHDRKTNGVMGLLPLVKDMPLRVITTEPAAKAVLFTNRRCRLWGRNLHPKDQA